MTTNNYISSLDNLIIYWINMDKSIKRRKYMKQVLHDPVFKGIPKTRIPAFDSEKQNVMDKLIITKKSPHMTPSTYGCLISHLDTIHTFSKSDYDFALIFEDDVSLREYKSFWNKPLDEIVRSSPPDWEILQLGFGLNDKNGLPKMEYTPMSIGNYYQTVSYLISKAGAKRFIKEYYVDGKYKLYNNICQEADNFIFNVLRTYTYQFPLFTNNNGLNSTIRVDKQNEKTLYSKFSQELLREHICKNNKNKKKTYKKCNKNDIISKKKVNWRATRCINGKRKLGFIKTIQNG